MAKTCCIIGAGAVTVLPVPKDAFVICADGGLSAAARFGVTPDLIVGDFDSLGEVPQGSNVVVHPVEKDETDSFLALRLGLEHGCDRFLFFGCLGGRLDHTLANIQHLHYLAERGAEGVLVGEHETLTAVKNGVLRFPAAQTGGVSVFSLSDKSEGVSIKGLHYEAEGTTLTNRFPLGVSNRFEGREAVISVENGTLLVVLRDEA